MWPDFPTYLGLLHTNVEESGTTVVNALCLMVPARVNHSLTTEDRSVYSKVLSFWRGLNYII